MGRWEFPVEVKVTVDANIDSAIESLELRDSRLREIWFLDDDTPGLVTDIPLLNTGVILRLRSDVKRDQSTIKLRPARKSQLVGRWQAVFGNDDHEYRIESDWAGSRRVLAASCVVEFPAGTFASQLADGDISAAFSRQQVDFITECAGIPLDIAGLTAFGPISARQWKDQKLGGIDVTVERWSIDRLDFLELSARADTEVEASQIRAALIDAVRANGLTADDEQAPKTTTMLRHLMQRDHR